MGYHMLGVQGKINVFTLAGRDNIASFTPPTKITSVLLPDAPVKTKNMKMDIDQESSNSISSLISTLESYTYMQV